ncbi:MAG: hypothetical protein IJ048_11210, partial [Clostridia bacterium]|nr:hypothetical protein [Clostridia bacterium]
GSAHGGRGGWTWYTGAAAWMLRAAWTGLMGLEKRGERVSLHALLPEGWTEASVVLRAGRATYRLTALRGCREVRLDGAVCPDGTVHLLDDGRAHSAVFPPRN